MHGASDSAANALTLSEYARCTTCYAYLVPTTAGCTPDCDWSPHPDVVNALNREAPALAAGRAADERHALARLCEFLPDTLLHGRSDEDDEGQPDDPTLVRRTAVRWVHERAKLRALTCPKAAAAEACETAEVARA